MYYERKFSRLTITQMTIELSNKLYNFCAMFTSQGETTGTPG